VVIGNVPNVTDAQKETPDWGLAFDERSHLNEALRGEILFTLLDALEAAGIKTHSVVARVKKRKSFLEKITRKNYQDPFIEMPDIVGARIVCLFMNDLPKLKLILHQKFRVLIEEDKVESAPADSFGYMSVHYECELKSEHSGPRYDKLRGIRFEIQCRTLLMDAWANVSHHLEYKGEASIPEPLRRNFHALSGLFYVADQNFQALYDASGQADRAASDQPQRVDRASIPIDRSTVRALLRELYADRKPSDLTSISEFVEEVAEAGYEKLDDLRQVLVRADALAKEQEFKHPPHGTPGKKFFDVGIARNALAVADPAYAEAKYDGLNYRKYHDRYQRLEAGD
jgi:putative GTP pyrophosphokinase